MRNLKTIALIMPKENGLCGRRVGEDGRSADDDGEGRLVVGSDTICFRRRYDIAIGYVECLRGELEKGEPEHWGEWYPECADVAFGDGGWGMHDI